MGGIFLSIALIGAWGGFRSLFPPKAPSLATLEKKGKVESLHYEVRRALAIAEFGDEGAHYLLELTDGSILCLRGQYLYELEGRAGKDGLVGKRRFPNTRFELKRHRETEDTLDLVCLGKPFKPECVMPHLTEGDFESSDVLYDGEISTSCTFDQLIAAKGRLPKLSTEV